MPGSRIATAPPEGPNGPARTASFLRRAEVRDVLAWLRLLVDPQDAAAVVRALARPPIELRQVELARVIQVARRRKLDLVLGLAAATESPHVPPEARERIQRFVELHRSAVVELDTLEPDVFMRRLIDRLGVRGRRLLAPEDAAGQRASLGQLQALAADFLRRRPESGVRELTVHLATVLPQPDDEGSAAIAADSASREPDPSPRAGRADDAEVPPPSDDASTDAGEAAGELDVMLGLLREEVLGSVARIGGRLSELRLDTELDISHGVVRYLELLKVAAVLQRPEGQTLADALSDVNARLAAATTPLQREILLTSPMDEALLSVERDEQPAAHALTSREGHSLRPFLPRRGVGLALSASDIHTYRSCPLRYKFARVLRIPTEQTVHQRFGIVVHQVLERFHSEGGGGTLGRLLELLDVGWRRSGLGEGPRELALREKAAAALTRYHARLHQQGAEPVWFERAFDFRLGPHHLRGRVDRVDRLAGEDGESYELIDYKTSRPKTAEQLADDVQLSLYALAAREAWELDSSSQAYYYVLDDLKVPVLRSDRDADAVKEIVLEVGEGILAQTFEPTPSPAACSMCDYRIVCPVAEA